ncbi:MAG: tetratricopeptide repeat protein [Gemmataceae bacterium]|nr:tetratricopeptide repeat protein [Gemmataceae bacterium]
MLLLMLAMLGADDKAVDLVLEADRLHKQRKYAEALKLLDQAIKKEPKSVAAHDLRGSTRYMAGDFKGAVADFDHVLELEPKALKGHWRRGIALYYVGRYEDGYKQFDAYQGTDTSDVENTFWHWMCYSRKHGLEKAGKALLKTGKDKRIPMNEVLALIQGKLKPEDVLKAAEAGKPGKDERKSRLFYAHLYLGLWHEQQGDRKKALEHLALAASKDYHNGTYMGEVARVHHAWLKARKP